MDEKEYKAQISSKIDAYSTELRDLPLTRPFLHPGEPSLLGFKEVLVRFLELEKMKMIKRDGDTVGAGFAELRVNGYEEVLGYLDGYMEGTVNETFLQEAQPLEDYRIRVSQRHEVAMNKLRSLDMQPCDDETMRQEAAATKSK